MADIALLRHAIVRCPAVQADLEKIDSGSGDRRFVILAEGCLPQYGQSAGLAEPSAQGVVYSRTHVASDSFRLGDAFGLFLTRFIMMGHGRRASVRWVFGNRSGNSR